MDCIDKRTFNTLCNQIRSLDPLSAPNFLAMEAVAKKLEKFLDNNPIIPDIVSKASYDISESLCDDEEAFENIVDAMAQMIWHLYSALELKWGKKNADRMIVNMSSEFTFSFSE